MWSTAPCADVGSQVSVKRVFQPRHVALALSVNRAQDTMLNTRLPACCCLLAV